MVWLKDGKEALDFLFATGSFSKRDGNQTPRVILLDLKMPRIDGLEVLTAIRSNPLTKHIPVVVLTSSNEEQDIVRSYQLGVNSFIVKPVEFDKFSACVKEVGLYWALINQAPEGTNKEEANG
ncbi:MAG: response regulator [Cyclobacteriaceae bacterium]